MAKKILLTGATGYVGGRLLKELERQDVSLCCYVRRPEVLQEKVLSSTRLIQGDVLEEEKLEKALKDIDTAYYLVHSLGSQHSFREKDRQSAQAFANAAKRAEIRKIIYLGGLGTGPHLSEHLESRQEVGRILKESGIPIIEFRASIIIGSGSLSFEIIRALVKRLPIMTAPSWVHTKTQPIAVEDVIAYLSEALHQTASESKVYDIGGPDLVSYGDLLKEYARQRGLKRIIIPVPVLSPYLSSLWLDLVTPIYARIGRHLIEGLRNETIVRNDDALKDFSVVPMTSKAAISRALVNEDQEFAETRWADALSSSGSAMRESHQKYKDRIIDSKTAQTSVSSDLAFLPIQRIGGNQGWYCANALWKVRGFIDRMIGGVGLRRGRRDRKAIAIGDAVDFWRVEGFEPDRLLRLKAEMKLPGRAWLQFEVEPTETGSIIRQTAIFDPRGWAGIIYWYTLYPLHSFIFRGMLKGIKKQAENGSVTK